MIGVESLGILRGEKFYMGDKMVMFLLEKMHYACAEWVELFGLGHDHGGQSERTVAVVMASGGDRGGGCFLISVHDYP